MPETQNSIRMAMQKGVKKSINVDKFLKNAIGDNRILDQKFLGSNISFERGITGVNKLLSSANNKKNEIRDFMIEKLQEESINKIKHRKESADLTKRTPSSNALPVISPNNKKLQVAYMREKRKLELDMLKLNEKLGTTAKILNLIRYDKSPTPIYKFKEFKEKIEILNKYKNAKKNR